MKMCPECNGEFVSDDAFEHHQERHFLEKLSQGNADAFRAIFGQLLIMNILMVMRMEGCSIEKACFKLREIGEKDVQVGKTYMDRGLPNGQNK